MEYQEESPMPSRRRDRTPFDKMLHRRPREQRIDWILDDEAVEWVERVVKHNRRCRRPPYDTNDVVNKIILGHKSRTLAKMRAKKAK